MAIVSLENRLFLHPLAPRLLSGHARLLRPWFREHHARQQAACNRLGPLPGAWGSVKLRRGPWDQWRFLVLLALSSLVFMGSARDLAAQTPTETDVSDVPSGSVVAIPQVKDADKEDAKKTSNGKPTDWTELKDSWVISDFPGAGAVEIKGNVVKLAAGDPITGVRWAGPLLRENYEIIFEARRTDGHDFFCALTFPVGESVVSLVLGGWGGGVVGLSSIDGADASENPSTSYIEFEKNRWYRVRVRVDEKAISYWIDDQLHFAQPREERQFSTRLEMDLCEPLGIASYQTDSEIRKLKMRKL
ncbi:hypothetical protein Q31b_29300 [Novipirellula aureliae]|uniref:3-keto-disaccharide hydrolase domain-containing protein n=1 Tax=Novipirellula aureliae TaxID=2527966 RepID=A0A5C6E1E2_9BACT|nr:hypothetical protein [Novipirellula aureliae]TWU41481.1 hypothetical protein Q31b_29300 [Novipirellula aureliae]